MSDSLSDTKIIFKKKVKKNLRLKNEDNEDDDDLGIDLKKLNDLKELREFKGNRLRGLSADELLKLKSETTGKLMKNIDSDQLTSNVDLGNTFLTETNRRDEDADMLKFIEEELAKRKGKKTENEDAKKLKLSANLDEIVFSDLPENLLNTNKNKNEEMLSNQMLSGIPEVDLGFEEKIRNIEATEEAKNKKIIQSSNKQIQETSFVPANLAVNYVQHNKFLTNDHTNAGIHHQQQKKQKIEPIKLIKEPVVVIGDEPIEIIFKVKQDTGERMLKHPGREHASDNYHYEKFKKQFRK